MKKKITFLLKRKSHLGEEFYTLIKKENQIELGKKRIGF